SNQALDQIGAFIKGSKASPFQHFVESWQSYFALSAFSEIASPGSCPKIRSCQTGFGRGTLGLGSWHMRLGSWQMGSGSWQICSRKQITPMFSTGISSNHQMDVLFMAFLES